MTLPTSRDFTLGAASPVPSALLNTLQDQIIGGKRASVTKSLLATAFQAAGGAWTIVKPGAGIPPYFISGAGSYLHVGIPVEQGARITAASYSAFGDGAADCDAKFFYSTGAMVAGTQLATITDINRAAAWADVPIVAFTAHVFAAGEFGFFEFNNIGANYRIGRVTWTYDRL